ncbi:MAG: hypothetical protein HQM00_01785 [Magnetococcales bacterium]|nr:hypothetical protein [Magnetococcales bacterium]
MAIRLADLAYSVLVAACGAGDTGIVVASSASFPVLSAGDYTFLTLASAVGREIVKATAISGNTITVVRAQGGTSALAFGIGARVELRLCSAVLAALTEGFMIGPASSVDGAVAMFDGTGGRNLKQATVASGTVLGRTSPGSGAIEVLVLSQAGALIMAAATAADQLALLAASGPRFPVFVPAHGMVPRVTNGPSLTTAETATNKIMVKTIDFDAATAEFAQFFVRMPEGWNAGSVTFKIVWSHAATSVNFGVRWEVRAVALANGDAIDTPFGAAVGINCTGGVAGSLYTTALSASLTIANTPSKSDYIVFEISRNVSDANDTMVIDARLHGVTVVYTADSFSE